MAARSEIAKTVNGLFDWSYCKYSTYADSKEEAFLRSGSRVVRRQSKNGISFQLFLNHQEKNMLLEANVSAFFYSNCYVYIPPKYQAFETLKLLRQHDEA